MQRIGCGKKVHEYLEYHSVCPLVRIGTPHPLSRERVYPHQESKGGEHSPAGEGVGRVPIRTAGKKAQQSVYSVDSCLAVIAGG
jgi:hypothetical protein